MGKDRQGKFQQKQPFNLLNVDERRVQRYNHGCRKGGQGPHCILKLLAQKGCFFNFEG